MRIIAGILQSDFLFSAVNILGRQRTLQTVCVVAENFGNNSVSGAIMIISDTRLHNVSYDILNSFAISFSIISRTDWTLSSSSTGRPERRFIYSQLDFKIASTIATRKVHAKLDYSNALFLNIDIVQINRLHCVEYMCLKFRLNNGGIRSARW